MRLPLPVVGRRLARGLAAALLAGVAAAPAALQAQDPDTTFVMNDSAAAGRRAFEVSAVTGYQWFDQAAAIRGAPVLGVRIVNPRLLGRSGVTLGFTAAVARPTTRGDYFPWNRQIYYSDINRRNDTTLVFEVSQRLSMATYGAEIGYRFGGAPVDGGGTAGRFDFSRLDAEVSAGIGGYAFWEDPEQNRSNQMHSNLALALGAGIGIPLPARTAIRLRLDDQIFLNYDREWFSLHDPLFSEELFTNPSASAPAPKSTIHNLRLSVQFSFFPGTER